MPIHFFFLASALYTAGGGMCLYLVPEEEEGPFPKGTYQTRGP